MPRSLDPIVVVGASAGGLASLQSLVAALPADFPGPVLVVQHVAAQGPSHLPHILSRAGPLHAAHAEHDEPIRPGRVYVARPDHHLLVDGARIGLSRGPKENRFRPSIDALFRSAAYTYGPRVIGVVLSGQLDDGTSGLWTVKRLGGTTIVQDPADAAFESMPVSALRHVEVDHCAGAARIGALIGELARARAAPAPREREPSTGLEERIALEVGIAAGANAFEAGILGFSEPTSLTCPECHGALGRVQEGTLERYRCHTGHAFSASALLAETSRSVETSLTQAKRALEECVLLLDRMAQRLRESGDETGARACSAEARAAETRARRLHDALVHERPPADESLLVRRADAPEPATRTDDDRAARGQERASSPGRS